jgi:hypothetical protein
MSGMKKATFEAEQDEKEKEKEKLRIQIHRGGEKEGKKKREKEDKEEVSRETRQQQQQQQPQQQQQQEKHEKHEKQKHEGHEEHEELDMPGKGAKQQRLIRFRRAVAKTKAAVRLSTLSSTDHTQSQAQGHQRRHQSPLLGSALEQSTGPTITMTLESEEDIIERLSTAGSAGVDARIARGFGTESGGEGSLSEESSGLFGFEDVAQAQAALGQAMPDPLMLQEQEKKRQQREKPAGRASILLQVHARACRVSFRHITLLSISISATFFYNFSYPLQYNRNC